MASSPLEVYEKAYRLHYDENDISRACEIYRQLIREFPESNESGYAAIQLQKIEAEDLVRKLDKKKPQTMLIVVALVLCMVTLVTYAVLGFLLYQNTQAEARKSSLVAQALGFMCLNRDTDALRCLEQAKDAELRDISPYVLSADIYLRRGDLASARAEYDTYNRRHGGKPAAALLPDKPAASAQAPAPAQPAASDSAVTGSEAASEDKQPVGARLSDKNSVIKFLDSISGTP